MVVMLPFESLIPKRPLSHQAKDKKHKQDWKNFVYGRAFSDWKGPPVANEALRFILIYLCEEDPPDINNIIKPVQDALSGVVYSDDRLVIDIQGHLRMTDALIDVTGLPKLLQTAILNATECLYIRVESSCSLVELL